MALPAPQGRRSSTFARLLRHGFTDPSAAGRLLDAPELASVRDDPVLLDALGATADPDLALLGLVRLVEAQDTGRAAGAAEHPRRGEAAARPAARGARRLRGARRPPRPAPARLAVAGHLRVGRSAPRHRRVRAGARRGDLGRPERRTAAADALRVAYRRSLLAIAARDVCGTTDVAEAAAELADLATATLRAALEIAYEEAPEDAAVCRLAVIGMGKCGGRELNYVSDVDVIFVAEAKEGVDEAKALQAATRLAARMMRICSDTTAEGTIWPVDANLRPEGRNGPLVRTLSSHLAYYQRWAKTWEFQALLKARPVAGDLAAGAGVRGRAGADGVAGRRAGELRRRCAADAPPGRREHPRGPGRAGAQARPRRPARRRIRRPAAAAGARPQRCHAAQRHHPRRPRGAGRRRLRRTPGRRGPGRRLPLPAHAWSTASSSSGCAVPI